MRKLRRELISWSRLNTRCNNRCAAVKTCQCNHDLVFHMASFCLLRVKINTLSKALLGDQNGAQNSRRSPPDKGSNRSSGRPPTPSSTRNTAGRSQPRHLQRHSSKRRVGVSSPQSLDGQSRSGYSKGNSSEDPGEQSKPHKDSADDQSSDESQDLTERDLEIQTEDTLELALMRTESLTVSTSSENEDEPESKLQSTPVSSSGAAEL